MDLGIGGTELGSGLLSEGVLLGLGDGLLGTVVGGSVLSKNGGVRVELGHEGLVLEGILVGGAASLGLGLGGSESALDLIGIDDLGNVGVGDDAVHQTVVLSLGSSTLESTESSLEGLGLGCYLPGRQTGCRSRIFRGDHRGRGV